jgi:hypothetical protein
MNPLAVALLLIGIVLVVSAFRDKQDNVISAITGKRYGDASIK